MLIEVFEWRKYAQWKLLMILINVIATAVVEILSLVSDFFGTVFDKGIDEGSMIDLILNKFISSFNIDLAYMTSRNLLHFFRS